MRTALIFLSALLFSCQSGVEEKRISFIFDSKNIGERRIRIWTPQLLDSNAPLAVLYMHDAQMLFDPDSTWNKQAWIADKTVQRLIDVGRIKPTMIVGIDNAGSKRHAEYFPQRAFEMLDKKLQDSLLTKVMRYGSPMFDGPINSDNYLKFLVEELKPYIDSSFNTLTDKENTVIMGSSMGGLISMYAICEYPEVFGGAGCMSTHWPVLYTNKQNPVAPAIRNYLKSNSPKPASHKLYFDFGTETLDSLYEVHQLMADSILKSADYSDENLMSLKFEGTNHSEKAWSERLYIPLEFLLGNSER